MKTFPGLVSCILPTYNRLPFLKICIESIFNQSYRPIELIIVDDASTDGTYDYCCRLARESNMINYIRMNSNSGCVSVPRSIGISYASGEFIAHVDDDVFSYPKKIETLVSCLYQNPESSLAYGRRKICGAKLIGDEVIMTTPMDDPNEIPFWDPMKECGVDGGQYIYRSNIYAKSKMVLCKNACDMRTAQQVYKQNSNFVFVPEVVCLYLVHENNRSTNFNPSTVNIDLEIVKKYFNQNSNFTPSFLVIE